MTQVPNADTIVPWLASLMRSRGPENYLGEHVSVGEHMLQCAAFAENEGAPDVLVAASLLHDVGHLMEADGEAAFTQGVDTHHDTVGADLLAPFFPAVVVACVRLHVAAKRYLCATDPGYFGRLSAASVHTLALQGGPMSMEQVEAFERLPHSREAVRVRRWDELGKIPGFAVPPFEHYAPLLERLVTH